MLTEARWRQLVPKPHRKWSPPCAIHTPYLPLHMTPARYQGHTCGQGQRGGCWAHQGTLRCPLLALQCWGCFSHLSGDPVLSLCLPLVMMHCPLLLPLPELWLGQADCYSSCISSSQASGFLKQPQGARPSPGWGLRPVPPCAGSCPRPLSRDHAKAPSRAGSALACHRFPVPPPAALSARLAFLNLYPSPLGEQSIPGYLPESSLDMCPTSRAW